MEFKRLTVEKDPKEMDPDFQEYLEKYFINPIEEKGGEFTGYAHAFSDDESCLGVHILIFEKVPGSEFLESLMDQDDNQPRTTFQRYFGAAWIFIPYCG